MNKVVLPKLSYKIMGILFKVQNELGSSLLEKYYQRAIEQELGPDNNYQLWIIGGTGKGQKSREEELIGLFTSSKVLNGRFVGKDMYGGADSVRSIALDSRDGKVYTFRGLGPINVGNGQFALYGTPAIKVSDK